jgi:hypothetical protein
LFREVTQVLDNTSVAQPGAQGVEPVGDDSHTNREYLSDQKETALRKCALPKGCRTTLSV